MRNVNGKNLHIVKNVMPMNESYHISRQDKRERQDLFYSAQFYRTLRLKLQRQLNTVQLRNKRKKKNVTIN